MKPTSPDPSLRSDADVDTGDAASSANASSTHVSVSPPASNRADRLAELLLHWEEAAARGQKLSAEEICRECPELLNDFRELLQDLKPIDAVLKIEQATSIDGQPNFSAGRYRPVRFHAAGGLGQVFVAEDTELARTVALKQLKVFHSADVDARNRFVLEAEITGRLEHPGVVPIYGLGMDNEGRPFYAMRFLSGQTFKQAIQEFHAIGSSAIRDRAVEFRKLLRHWIAACETVAFAHGRGVIHRDLKPANIMLGAYGETWVVDWGLAKRIEQSQPGDSEDTVVNGASASATHVNVEHSATGEVKGTPMYMAPEQAEGRTRQLGPAADIYSLGAVLCELLSGVKPFAGNSSIEVIEQVKRGAMVAPRSVNPHVPMALEAVARKAMALSPSNRYATAKDLADDVERWLADEPVSAYPEPLPERARRWLRRHRTFATMAVLLLLVSTILLGIGFVLVTREKDQKERARKNEQEQRLIAVAEHRRARSALDRATDGIVGDFLTSQLQRLDERQKGYLRELLHDYESFARQPEDDEETRQQVASAFLRAGKIQFLIGELDASEAALRQAIGRYVELAERHPEKLRYLQAAADGHIDLFRIFRARNDLTNAQAEVAQAGDRYARLVQIQDDPKYRMQLALCRAEAGVIASDAGQEEVAERLFRQVREAHAKLRATEMDSIFYIREEGRNLQNLALVEEKQGRLPEALATLTEAERWFQMLHQKSPDDADTLYRLAMFEHSFAVLLDKLNRGKEAAQRHADALSYAEALGQQLPNHLLVRRELIRIRWNYLLHLQRYGQHQQAIALCKRSTAESERLSARFPQIPIFKHQQARFAVQEMQLEIDDMVRRGDVSAAFKKLPEQEKLLRQVLATQDEAYKLDPKSVDGRLWLAEHLDKLASNLLVSGTLAPQKLKESLTLFDRAVQLQGEVAAETPGTPQNRLDLAAYYSRMAASHGRLGQTDASDAAHNKAISILQELTDHYPKVWRYRAELGGAWLAKALEGRFRGREASALAKELATSVDLLHRAYQENPLESRTRTNLVQACSHGADVALKLNDYRSAAAMAVLYSEAATKPAIECVQAARFLARCSKLASQDERLSKEEKSKSLKKFGDQAVASLQRAHDAGFRDAQKLRGYDDLEPLHAREDYQKLLAAMEKK